MRGRELPHLHSFGSSFEDQVRGRVRGLRRQGLGLKYPVGRDPKSVRGRFRHTVELQYGRPWTMRTAIRRACRGGGRRNTAGLSKERVWCAGSCRLGSRCAGKWQCHSMPLLSTTSHLNDWPHGWAWAWLGRSSRSPTRPARPSRQLTT